MWTRNVSIGWRKLTPQYSYIRKCNCTESLSKSRMGYWGTFRWMSNSWSWAVRNIDFGSKQLLQGLCHMNDLFRVSCIRFVNFRFYWVFKIAVNGRHFCEFVHRLPFNTSNYLLINGAVHVTSVKLEYDSPQATAPPVPSKCVCCLVIRRWLLP